MFLKVSLWVVALALTASVAQARTVTYGVDDMTVLGRLVLQNQQGEMLNDFKACFKAQSLDMTQSGKEELCFEPYKKDRLEKAMGLAIFPAKRGTKVTLTRLEIGGKNYNLKGYAFVAPHDLPLAYLGDLTFQLDEKAEDGTCAPLALVSYGRLTQTLDDHFEVTGMTAYVDHVEPTLDLFKPYAQTSVSCQ